MQTQSAFNAIRLGQNHGYRIDNDTVALNADLAIANDITTAQPIFARAPEGALRHWALQLWACDEPYAGGPLFGIKVAEAAVQLPVGSDSTAQRLDAQTAAITPAGQRDYSMVLVLASGQPGDYQVHDFANYPARERFVGPQLEGSVGYAIDGDQVVISAEKVFNARTPENLSGSLTLELWALPTPHVGGGFEGTQLAQVDLGRVAGQDGLEGLEYRVAFNTPAPGNWHVALMLREWTANAGYITRDFCNFAATYQVEPAKTERAQIEPAKLRLVEALAKVEPVETITKLEAPVSANVEEPKAIAKPEAAEAVKAEEPKAVAKPEAAAPVKAEPVKAEPAKIVAAKREAPGATKVEAHVAAKIEAPVAAKAENTAPAANGRVSVMRGTIEELAQVKGLNRKLAAEIIKARPFTSIDDLQRVRGIGERMLQTLRAYVTL